MSAKSLLRYRGGGGPDSRSPESPGPRKSDNDLGLGPEPPPSEKRLQEHDSSLDEGIDDILAQVELAFLLPSRVFKKVK